MYRIIGADQREYGPASADDVRRWVMQGRANAQTLVRPEGGGVWRTLGSLPEFAGVLAATTAGSASAGATRDAAPGSDGARSHDDLAAETIARDARYSIEHCLGRGWDMVRSRFWLTVGACIVVWLILALSVAVPFAPLLLVGPLTGGLMAMFLKIGRGQPAGMADVFSGFGPRFLPLMLAGLVGTLLTSVGWVLCLLPGLYLWVAWQFAYLLVIDRGLDFWPALETSRRVITNHWWHMLGLLIVCWLLNLLGTLLCLVGVLVTTPIIVGAIVQAYESTFAAGAPRVSAAPSSPSSSAPQAS